MSAFSGFRRKMIRNYKDVKRRHDSRERNGELGTAKKPQAPSIKKVQCPHCGKTRFACPTCGDDLKITQAIGPFHLGECPKHGPVDVRCGKAK